MTRMNPLSLQQAKDIIEYVTRTTKPRWQEFAADQTWERIDEIFIQRGYEQLGLEMGTLYRVLQEQQMHLISDLGQILGPDEFNKSYKRDYAGSFDALFYGELIRGVRGERGRRFAAALREFILGKRGKTGGAIFMEMWRLLQACAYLVEHHQASFQQCMLDRFDRFKKEHDIAASGFLSMNLEEWDLFKNTKPWLHLTGIGPNVFDFIFGDLQGVVFNDQSYKLDSANEYFLNVTGISKLIGPELNKDTVRNFLAKLSSSIAYTIREINKGIYTYCSETESENFGFCRKPQKCQLCKVENICERQFLLKQEMS